MTGTSFHLMDVFVRVAEARSFTGAAARLGISPSAASKAILRLEQKLGVRLVVRTTRSVGLTEEGEILLGSCRHVLAEIESAEAQLAGRSSEPVGRLRLHSTVSFGRCVIVPLLSEFARQWPRLTIDVDMSERAVNLHQEAFDLTVCFGSMVDSMLVARRLGHVRLVTVASVNYLELHGEPRDPSDLGRHACLGHFQPLLARYRDWEYRDGHTRVSPSGHLNYNNAQALLEAVVNHQGVAQMARFVAYDALRAGHIREVLPEYATPGWPVWLVYTERRYQTKRVKVLVDFLLDRIPAALRSYQGDGPPQPNVMVKPPVSPSGSKGSSPAGSAGRARARRLR